jgi:hypothetical protein
MLRRAAEEAASVDSRRPVCAMYTEGLARGGGLCLSRGCSSHRDAFTRGFGGALCGLSAMTFASRVTWA